MENHPHPYGQEPSRNALNYQFSPEELKVLRECNREAFYQRSVPIGTAFGLGTYYAVQRGMLKPSPRFGAGPKVLVGVTLGYFVGKFSYQTRCAEKILQLPNSRLADMIRQRRQGSSGGVEKLLPDQGFGTGTMLSPFGPTTPSDRVTEERLRSSDSINLDMNIPHYSGLDDSGRPTVDSSLTFEEDLQLPPSPPVTKSYEELRRQNREEYINRKLVPQRPAELEEAPSIRREPERVAPRAEDPPLAPQMKNKYGDSWSQ